ncbi:DUF4240 domain-containing protein [Nocardia goodfellowii]|uniref:DUF4240 domain-containing protein n=1 Tax=Nocardia goodfellowii TaxID=882446 RepID=A0ABS4QM07_9NOCA|nr:DUF4240 domain-containing protein [Nocardia goodfellowii]MBP2192735.1 hypothetical protein [Nocardia goodfellowii]
MSEIPTAADESRFWNIIESAWEQVGAEPSALRGELTTRGDVAETLEKQLSTFLDQLRALAGELPASELTALDRVLERKMYDLDRADIHRVIGGSDDGFLYGRGFIVAMGKDYYEAVAAAPETAARDAECGAMGYFFAHLHNERFGGFPRTGGGITRESMSNPSGWA